MNDPEHEQMDALYRHRASQRDARHIDELHARSDRTDVAPGIKAAGWVAIIALVSAGAAFVWWLTSL